MSFLDGLKTWLRGLALLRFPETTRILGESRLKMMQMDAIRKDYPTAKLAGDLILMAFQTNRFMLGQDVTFVEGTVLSFGDPSNGYGNISIGNSSWIGQYNNLRACADGNISIGNNCLISQFCSLVGSNHKIGRDSPIIEQGADHSRLGVVLEDDVWLGACVTVMPGVTIGKGVVIGANAVVTKDVPEYEIWAGVPARKIGKRE